MAPVVGVCCFFPLLFGMVVAVVVVIWVMEQWGAAPGVDQAGTDSDPKS